MLRENISNINSLTKMALLLNNSQSLCLNKYFINLQIKHQPDSDPGRPGDGPHS